jgi:hypothetical protein
MSNLTLAIDEHLLAAARDYAKDHGTTVNSLVRELLERTVRKPVDPDWLKRISARMQRAGTKKPWSWNREEVYDDRMQQLGVPARKRRVAEPGSAYRTDP